MRYVTVTFLILLLFLSCGLSDFYPLKTVSPQRVGMNGDHLAQVRTIINEAIEKGEIPGAVLLVTRYGKIVFREAFGNSQLVPEKKPMRPDMIFDMASVTKPIATATSVMKLVEQGKIRLWDRVSQYVPEFTSYVDSTTGETSNARIWHLLTHTSGLLPYTNADTAAAKLGSPCPTDSLVKYIGKLPKMCAAGEEFHYSCLGFITLAYIIKQVSGQTVHEFSQKYIFEPLQMFDTGYQPDENLLSRCVPTEVINGTPLIGTVHDPLARLQGGISGNAGLFSTVDDLAIFAQMMLQGGSYKGTRILSPLTVDRMTEIFPAVAFSGRGIGWDLNSDYSTNGGDLFGPDSYGHSGYTGTSFWVDPETQTAVIFLTNRVHPNDGGSVVPLRSKVANIVASSIVKK